MATPLYCIEWENKKKPGERHTGPTLYKIDEIKKKKIPKTRIEAAETARHANKSFPNSIHRAILYGKPQTVKLKEDTPL